MGEVLVPSDDPTFTQPNECLPFFRSAPACVTQQAARAFGQLCGREQLNSITSFMDANMVYGSTEAVANIVKDQENNLGLLRVNNYFTDNGRELLPFVDTSINPCGQNSCKTSDKGHSGIPCFQAGDSRANEHIRMTVLHTLFLREHNRLARELKKLNPHWDGETIYQEARKIMGALQQIITYKDYLPKILGPKAMKKFLPVYRGYDSSIDSSIKNAFSTAVFRFGHSTVSEVVPRLKKGYKEDPEFPNLQMRETFFNPNLLINAGQIERLLRGLINFPNKLSTQNTIMVADLRNHLFENISRITQDLASLNMQRGRDHGLRGYGDWREFCGLQAPKNRMDLSKLLKNPQLANELIKLYGTPKNIDLWLAGIIEPFVRGGRVGPLFACLIGKQFRDVRNGDRFWWEKQGVFTAEQRQALRSISLARIICDNTRIKRLTRDVFVFHLFPENYVNCRQIPKLDLRAWKVANVYPDTS
ncbi:myeloperoxidase-like [Scyliorhinus canicula]|uniref:myeloperoxidase-like n=1 Tax=Scyliorhinus canicula TaxID=7830 RepID=UPI0018F4790E|nr:myeloperoxidase-like [Scyliorhinus canicula]